MKTFHCSGHIKESYPLHLSNDETFEDLFSLLPRAKNTIVVIDKAVAGQFGGLEQSLRDRNLDLYYVEANENDKSWLGLEQLLAHAFSKRLNRDDIIVAIGGGIVMNLAGLAGSLIMRGIRFYYVPTTLTGQIDACMGSKQAVNFNGAKNWVGLFNDPESCYINPTFLTKLPDKELYSQAIEGYKLCLATNRDCFDNYLGIADRINTLDSGELYKFVEDMIRVKIPIVHADKTEENFGMSLLYGHTIGHAVEMLDHEHISHGEGVGLGMLAASRISHKLGLCSDKLIAIHQDLLVKLNLPTKIPAHISPEAVYKMLAHNKKNYSGEIRFVLLQDVGEMAVDEGKYYRSVPEHIIMQSIQEGY